MSTAIVTHANVDALVAAYESAKADIIAGFALLDQATKTVDAACYLDGRIGDRTTLRASRYGGHHTIDTDAAEVAILDVRRAMWHHIIARLEIRRLMSCEAWEKLQRDLRGDDVPEITHEAVHSYARQVRRELPEMFRASVQEVFSWLRPRSCEGKRYKRNSENEVPERVALPGAVEAHFNGRFHVSYGYGWSGSDMSQRLIALENVFGALDGRGELKSHQSELQMAIEKCPIGQGVGETWLAEFRCFKNRSLHLRFKRLDLLKRFNEIAGGARMRATESSGAGLATL